MSLQATARVPLLVGNEARAAALAEVLKAVAHPLRLRLVALLSHRPHCVSELAEALGAKQAIVSQQLRILRMHRLVTAEHREGRVVYHLHEPQLSHLVDCMEHCAVPAAQRPHAGGVTR